MTTYIVIGVMMAWAAFTVGAAVAQLVWWLLLAVGVA